MAKIGTNVQGRWTRDFPATEDSNPAQKQYALRADGILVRKVTHLNHDGSVWFSGGWKKVSTRIGRSGLTAAAVTTLLGGGWTRSS